MPSLTLSDRLIWFAHCPKAGGTSVERLMVDTWGRAVGHLHWGWDLWWRDGGWRTADPPNSPQHLIWADTVTVLPRAPDVVFALVRDPVARMQSEHRFQRRHRRGTRAGRLLAHLPFGLWLRLMLEVARINAYAFDNHLRPQGAFVPEGAQVFRLEDGLAPVADWLSRETGTRLPLPPHALKSGDGGRARAPAAARIAAVYAEDYARFGYDRPGGAVRRDLGDRLARIAAPLVVTLERRGRL